MLPARFWHSSGVILAQISCRVAHSWSMVVGLCVNISHSILFQDIRLDSDLETGWAIPLDEFFLMLCKLRHNFSEDDLAISFNIHQSTVSQIFPSWIEIMGACFMKVNWWPPRAAVQRNLLPVFCKRCSSARVLIECREIFIEKPQKKFGHPVIDMVCLQKPQYAEVSVGSDTQLSSMFCLRLPWWQN